MWGKIGFTLAEVLITLGIIGVVAAMTMPTLISNGKKQETIARLKKFNSTMAQAILLSERENGDSKYWDKSNTIYTDENGTPTYDNEAGPEATYNFIMKYIAPYIKAYKIEKEGEIAEGAERMVKIYFSDGSIAYVKNGACIDFRFDVNGEGKPNEIGRDQFHFILCPWMSQYYFGNANRKWGTYCSNRNDREAILNNRSCALRVLELDNWEFKDDYPWKL